jgi:RHS repeat-associated protein
MNAKARPRRPPYVHVAAGATQASFPIATELVATTETRSFNARFGGTVIAKTLQVLPPDGVIDLMLDEPGTLSIEGERRVGGSLLAMWLTVTPGSNTTATPTVTSSQYVFQFDEEPWPDPTWQRWMGRPALSVTQPTDVMVTAEYDGMVDRQRVVLLPSASTVSLESVGVDAVIGGSSATGAVGLSDVAPAGGITIMLTGSRAGLATVPASVTVPAGETSATFSVTTSATGTQRGTLVQASYGAQVRTAILAVNPPPSAIAPVPSAAAENVPQVASISAPIGPFGMASATVASSSVLSSDTEPIPTTRSFLYTPELNLLAETAVAVSNPETIAYEYLWFAGQPIAQITAATNEIAWYFNDHLGTPILQTDATGTVIWRIEREPYGRTFATRTGATRHQPLAFPGQEEQGGETAYNIFRWYRAGWGRYTQADPIALSGGMNLFGYANSSPTNFFDQSGLASEAGSSKECDEDPCPGLARNIEDAIKELRRLAKNENKHRVNGDAADEYEGHKTQWDNRKRQLNKNLKRFNDQGCPPELLRADVEVWVAAEYPEPEASLFDRYAESIQQTARDIARQVARQLARGPGNASGSLPPPWQVWAY